MSRSLLVVDDEPNILKAIERTFFETDYLIFTAPSADTALKVMAETSIDMVISDMRMPSIDGYQLLEMVRERHPEIIRVILSGHSDQENIVKTFSDGLAKDYLYKPWDNQELISWVDHCFEIDTLTEFHRLNELLSPIYPAKIYSPWYQSYLKSRSSNGGTEELTEIINENKLVAESLIHICNVPTSITSVSSVNEAVTRLGTGAVSDIVMALEVISSLLGVIDDNDRQHSTEILDHLIHINSVFHDLYSDVKKVPVPSYYEALSLLHDIGQLAMVALFGAPYNEFMHMKHDNSQQMIFSEQARFGVTHSQMGAYLAILWDLPLIVHEVCLFHHTPFAPSVIHQQEVLLISLSDRLAHCIHTGDNIPNLQKECSILGISEECLNHHLRCSCEV